MADPEADIERADREAADWFTRLGSKVVATKTIEDFYAWRRDRLNNTSYERIERLWSETARLRGDPDIDIAVRQALQRGADRRKAGLLADLAGKKGLGLAMIAIVCLAGAYFLTRSDELSTGVGEQKTVLLEDGTRVTLDTNSAVIVNMTEDQRQVQLTRGQVLFEVAGDRARPFVVSTEKGQVRAIGTRFEVGLRPAGMKVTLLEGAVEVRNAPQTGSPDTWTLTAGQQVTVGRTSQPFSKPRMVDVAAATSWTTGRLTFKETPLAEAVDEVNRYSRSKIQLEAGDVAPRPLNGAFQAGDPEAFAEAVAKLYDLEVTQTSDGKIVLQSPPQLRSVD